MPRNFPFGHSRTDLTSRLPRSACAMHAPSSPLVASRKIARSPFICSTVSSAAVRYATPKSLNVPVGPWYSSRAKRLSSSCFITGSKGKARVAMASQMMGLNSRFTRAEVRVPARFAKEVRSSAYRIHFRKSSHSQGTYSPPSAGMQSSSACLKSTILLLSRVLTKRMEKISRSGVRNAFS